MGKICLNSFDIGIENSPTPQMPPIEITTL